MSKIERGRIWLGACAYKGIDEWSQKSRKAFCLANVLLCTYEELLKMSHEPAIAYILHDYTLLWHVNTVLCYLADYVGLAGKNISLCNSI